ncbi:MAG: methyl-accepting chemotaxis protein [Syntrophomonadaceae bacterium]|nr:methyl-accepting chemotaxis protein [Syntrophomonadaceae bacterium]MDD3023978.1 methyl-accepting chemotaxis protein [Syntrophomonadaceae bacterium]
MARKLQRPAGSNIEKTGITVKQDDSDDIIRKREVARKMAQEKARARTLAKQQAMAERIASASEQLLAGIEESNAAAQEFSRLMNQVTNNGEKVGVSAEQMQGAVIQVNKAAVQLETDLGTLSQNARDGVGRVEESVQIMQACVAQIKEAASRNVQSGQRIAELEMQSRQIGDIVQAVVMIADQTNLLALNAAIEAARAGEHGRGFAVVADEVRNLAEISEHSARDIRGVVDEIRSGVEEVVNDINQVVDEFKKSEDGMAQAVDEGFIKVGQLFVDYVEVITLDAAEAVDLQKASDNFLTASEAIATAAHQLVSNTVESAKAVAEQSKALGEVNTATQELTEMAEELKTSTNINKSAEEVAATAEQLSANIEEISTSALEIATALNEMASGTRMARDESHRAETIAEHSAVVIGNLERISKEAGVMFDKVNELMEHSRQHARDVWAAVRESRTSYNGINSKFEALQEKIRRIEKIVDTIQNVSIQTNMLAVNGFVEAATAGEHGRGFSVVAGDIRNLATESAENADKIKDLVRDIQIQMSKVTVEIAQSEIAAQKADETMGVAAVKNQVVTKLIADITDLRNKLYQQLTEIKTSFAESEKVTSAVVDVIGSVGEQVEEASRVAQEQAKAVDELANSIEEIASIADEMQVN